MNRNIVRCCCGHQIRAKEVLRTDLYERRTSEDSVDYVCVRYRCRNCRRIGESFVAESKWDWRDFEEDASELSDREREFFSDAAPISADEMTAFQRDLELLARFETGAPGTQNAESETPREPRNAAPKNAAKPGAAKPNGTKPNNKPNAARGNPQNDAPRPENN